MTKTTKKSKKRAVIYARYSTKGQNDISVEDQINLCRKHAERDDFLVITECYADRAKSGGGILHRDELNKLLAAAKRREFDVLILESLDRLSRDLADMAGIWKDLKFWGVEIRTVNEGTATNVMIALRGLMGEMFLKDVGDKINRHHAGRAREGKIPGALSYGYCLISNKPGDREINPEQAKIVVRIFEQYAAGISPRRIAEPGRRLWS
jgi:site-specific DNA recombinase